MNRKQRYFAGIKRMMDPTARRLSQLRAEFGISARERGGVRRFKTNPKEIEPDVVPVKLAVVPYKGKNYDLNGKIEIDQENPGESLTGWLEAMRYQAREIFEKYGANSPEWKEALAKVNTDMGEVIKGYQETLKDYREHMRQPSEPARGKLMATALRHVDLRFDPAGEANLRSDKHSGSGNEYLRHMSLAQFNVICRSSDHLGIDPDDKLARRKHARLQVLHDTLSLAAMAMAKKDPGSFFRNGGWEGLRHADEYKDLALEFGQGIRETRLGNAINETNPDEGKNWVPGPILSARIFPKIEEEFRALSTIETIPMAALTQDSPVLFAHKKAYKLVENIADDGSTANAKVTASLWTTKKWSMTAKLSAAGAVATPNWMQDAIAGADDIIADLQYACEALKEDWFFNGQLSGAIDTISIATNDAKNMGDGVRKWWSLMKANNAGLVDVDFSAGIAADRIPAMFGQQLSYGNRPTRSVFFANTFAMAQLLVMKTSTGRDVVLTYGQAGDRATFRTGSIAQMFDRDIISTQMLSQTMDDTGLDAGTGTKTVLLHVFTDAIKHGQRLGVQVDMSMDYRFLEYQDTFRAVQRDDIGFVYDPTLAGNIFVSQAVGISKVQ